MTQEEILDIIEDIANKFEAKFFDDFIGIETKGATCPAIVTPNAGPVLEEAARRDLVGARRDYLNETDGFIIYWPQYPTNQV